MYVTRILRNKQTNQCTSVIYEKTYFIDVHCTFLYVARYILVSDQNMLVNSFM
jgi:hypothetical protein